MKKKMTPSIGILRGKAGLEQSLLENHLVSLHLQIESSAERSLGSMASPRGLSERSSSSTSLERNSHTNRPSIKWNLNNEKTGRSDGPIDGRGLPVIEGRLSREMSIGRHALDEPSQAELSFNSRSGSSNSSPLMPPQHPRSAIESCLCWILPNVQGR